MEVTKPIFQVCGTPTYVAPEILSEGGNTTVVYYTFTSGLTSGLRRTRLWTRSGQLGDWSDNIYTTVWISSF